MAVETVEAVIDDPSYDPEVGEFVEGCNGVVEGFDRGGVVVQVFPDPVKCDRCRFGENYCTASKAE